MTRLFALAGIDYLQWKAVSRTLLRTDFRAPTLQATESYSLRSIAGFFKMALVYGLFGLATAILVILNRDVLFTGTVTLTYLAFALATTLLTQQGVTMLASADQVILGPRPVSSRTIFAIRLTNVVFHAGLTTTLMAYPPVAAFTFAHGVNIARGFAAAVAIYAWTLTVTFAVVASYAGLQQVLGGARLQRAVAYVQMIVGVLAYGGLFLVMQAFGRTAFEQAVLTGSGWTFFLLPPAWFASYIAIATGSGSLAIWTAAFLSLGLLVGLALLLRGRLSLDFAARLAEPPIDTAPSRRRSLLFRRDEGRAVALLAAAHFRHDLRVRMGLFGVVPLLLIYMLSSVRGGGNPDPFLGVTRDGGVDLMGLVALMFPAIVLRLLESSEGHTAAWIYTATPADRGRLVIALKNIAALWFLAPFTLLLAALFVWRFGNVTHAIVHAALLAVVGHVTLQLAVLFKPRLPFAAPPDKSAGTTAVVWLIGVLLGGQLLLIAVQRFIYPRWDRVAALFATLMALSWLLEHAIRRRAAR